MLESDWGGQGHTLAALNPGEIPVYIVLGAGWMLRLVWTGPNGVLVLMFTSVASPRKCTNLMFV